MMARSKDEILQALLTAKNYMLTRMYGKDVRASLGDVAQAVYDAVDEQLTMVTTDVNSEDTNTALRVRTLKRLFPNFGGYLTDPDLDAIKGNVFYVVNLADTSIEFSPLPDLLAKAASLLLCFGDDGVTYQIFVGPYGDVFTRRYVGARDQWSAWNGGIDADLTKANAAADAKAVRDALEAIRAEMIAYNGLLKGGSIDGILGNVITMLNVSAYSYTTLPDGASGVMFLLSYGGDNLSGSSWQVLLGSTGRLWERRYTAGLWEAWQQVDQNTKKMIVNSRITVTAANKADYFTSCDDAPLNTIYRIKKNAELVNAPYGDGMSSASGVYDGTYRDIAGWDDGTLITYGTEDIYKHQIFISGKVSGASTGMVPPSNATLFFRTYYNSASPGWGDWRCVSDLRSPTATNIAVRRKFIGRWLDKDPETATAANPAKAVNTKTQWLNPQYMSDYLAPYMDGNGVPVPIDEGGYEANPNYVASHKFFTDFNDAPFNSIYQIDLDCVAEIMAHNPKPGKSSVLVTTGFSWVGMQHGKIQFCVGADAGTTFAYIRYGYTHSASQGIYVWTDWLHVGDAGEVDALKDRVAALEAQVAALGGTT